MDFLAPLIDFLRPLKDPLLLVTGAVLAWVGGALQANRTNNLQVDRERRDHYEKLLRALHEESSKPFNPEERERFEKIFYLLSTITPATSRRAKERTRQVEEQCVEAIRWTHAYEDPAFSYNVEVGPHAAYMVLMDHAIKTVSAAFHGLPLPEAPDLYLHLEEGQRKADEYHAEMHAEEHASEPS
ncbi:hypothetical protein [Nocardiopsis tropica]|uniref:Uncharacterized protein n=1 Tax=Nocardiopsis tropica TaxID=109330 RepID=A0ABU7KR01_9ACTN|nr:hypothetical protein [Nocardiopsis umidischolae]MEE2051718.1 hypothetical protein [Nocardiopsis umidischolae]